MIAAIKKVLSPSSDTIITAPDAINAWANECAYNTYNEDNKNIAYNPFTYNNARTSSIAYNPFTYNNACTSSGKIRQDKMQRYTLSIKGSAEFIDMRLTDDRES